jgi:hypothetical protein
MSAPSVSVTPCPGSGFTFDVIVRDLRGESRHQVTIEANEAEHWAKLGAEPSHCAEAVMRFLLDREPKESILSAFDMGVVRRYFPEFDEAFPATSSASAANRGAVLSRRPKYGGMLT